VAFKAVSAVAATTAVGLTYLWVRERGSPAFAAGVAFLVAASGTLLLYSDTILSDVPFLAFTLLSLWALARAGGGHGAPPGEAKEGGLRPGWLLLGCGAALLGFFTRTAGLPLVVAVALWLALRRRWTWLAGFGVAFGVPALLWWLRGRGGEPGGGDYLSEFWLRDPYRPELGGAGVGDLVAGVAENLWGYVSHHIPGGLTNLDGGALAGLGLTLVAASAWGWWLRIREERGVAELFVPLYFGLILLWPQVWSGDRFALPLLPLLLFYAGDGLRTAALRVHPRGSWGVAAAAVLFVALPALAGWADAARSASACQSRARIQGPWACSGGAVAEFAAAAWWSGGRLPEGAVVIARKPRIFHVLSGVKSQVFPFSGDPDRFFAEAEGLGSRYLLFDFVDGLSARYVAPVIRARPRAFCPLAGFEEVGGMGTRLLGIVPQAERHQGDPSSSDEESGAVRLSPCPEGLLRGEARAFPPYESWEVPLFSARDP